MTGQRAREGVGNPALTPLRVPGLQPATTLPPPLTWKMARLSFGVAAGWGVAAELASPESHSWMVTILRGGRCRWVRREFFRW